MSEKSLDEILEKLAWIGFNKELLPWILRGWVAKLGLHVQLFEGGKRIRAGGSLRSYLEAGQSEEGQWRVIKFHLTTWDRRFAAVLEPTYEISEYLSRHTEGGGLKDEFLKVFLETVQYHKATGEWLGLPMFPGLFGVRTPLETYVRWFLLDGEQERANQLITLMNNAANKDLLAKTMTESTFPWFPADYQWYDDHVMGLIFLTAWSKKKYGKGFGIWDELPSPLTNKFINKWREQEVNQLRDMALHHLTNEMDPEFRTGRQVRVPLLN